MTRAGFGKVELPVTPGSRLMGYANRDGGADGVDEPLHARAVVVETGSARVALCTVDLCWISDRVVAAARRRIAESAAVPADAIFVSATHTHSGPEDTDQLCWSDGLDAHIAAAVVQACERLEPARIGVGWGMLHGYSVNRRRLEDPIDPAVFVIRVDTDNGRPLGIYYSFACHPVIMGPDNRMVSSDWPGYASRTVEKRLGENAVAVFGQGACGDVNPLTPQLADRLAAGLLTMSETENHYYGPAGSLFDIGDRIGGRIDEVTRMGAAVADEVLRIWRGTSQQDVTGVWTRQLMVDGLADGPPWRTPPADHVAWTYMSRRRNEEPLEIMLVGIDGPGIVLIGQPGEPFVATGVELRRLLRNAGIMNPFVVGYANGYQSYLPPADAFVDGGYEVGWAWWSRTSETLQDDIRERVLDSVHARNNSDGTRQLRDGAAST